MAGRSLSLLVSCVALVSADLTPCQQCCQPGGDCSKAYKGERGACCGNVNGQSFCCPHYTTGAKCFKCNLAYRCYAGRASRNICEADGGIPGGRQSDREGGADSFISMVVLMGSAAVIVAAVSSCIRNRRSTPLMAQQTVELQVAKPVMPGQAMVAGTPCAVAQPAMPGGYPAGYPAAYPHHYPQQGYSGGNVAMGAGMGFLGGMMIGDMMADAGHHGGYGGDYGGGGGGDFGGGGGDFAADM